VPSGGAAERFGLAEAADRVSRGYSGGMQRRLDIAMGLIHAGPDRQRLGGRPGRAPGAGGRRVRVASVTIARPSLDDVYLRHAGRSLTKVAEEVSR
jgi:hypothetical protein